MKRIISNSVLLFCLSFCFLALPVSCSSSSATGTHVGYEYVDLGLSVKWATCNVGASSPEGYGSYFAWGETSPKSEYNWRNLKYCTEVDEWDNAKFSKYVAESEYGRVDNKTSLELDDDAASANWGGSWRMPTKEEFQELIYNCNWKWTTKDGQNGYKVVSKVNGKSISSRLPGGATTRISTVWAVVAVTGPVRFMGASAIALVTSTSTQ